MKRNIFSILFALVLVLALSLIMTVPIAAQDYEPTIGWWQSANPASGTAEYSTAQRHSADYSVYLEAIKAYSPNDYHEVYVANPTGVDSLADLNNVSFWYYCPSTSDEVAPLVDVWLDMDDSYSREYPPSGDDEWLLGMIADVTVRDTWVQVTHDDINWVRATGGTVYGYGSAGLTAALASLTDRPILAIGVETGGPGTYISSRDGDQEFYIDDLTINSTTYAMDPRIINTTKGTGYNTIQDAIDDASPGDTIEVAAGTYTEAVIISPGADLTIQGAGRDTTNWVAPADDPSRMHCVKCQDANNTNLNISGFTFSVEDNAISSSGIAILINRADDGPLYLDIHDNKFVETTAVPDETANSMLLCHNRYAARVDGVAPVKIHNNLDYTNGGIAMSNCRAFDVYGNTFDGGSSALYIGYGCPTGTTIGDHHIYDNTFRNASNAYPDPPWPAVYFAYYGSGTGMTFLPSTIESNVFEDNDVAIGYSMDSDITYPADIIRFNSFNNNTEAAKVFGTHATSVNAENNWWGDDSGPSGAGPGTGDAVSGNVDYDPWLGAELEEVEFETIADSGTMQDTATGGDVTITATGNHTIIVAKYDSNPGGTAPFANEGSYYDIHLDDATNVTSLTVQFCPAHENESICYWDGSSWVVCSDQVYSDGCIVVTITDDTQPSLSELTGLPFGKGFIIPVGGEAYPANKISLLAPWIAVAILLVGGVGLYALRRHKSQG